MKHPRGEDRRGWSRQRFVERLWRKRTQFEGLSTHAWRVCDNCVLLFDVNPLLIDLGS